MNCKKTIFLNFYSIMIVSVCLFCFSGCAVYDGITNYFNSTNHFLTFKKDHRIRYESGAEKFAAAVSSDLSSAVKEIESRQYSAFPDKITIYVCKSQESFKEMTGRDVSAMFYKKSVFLSPKLLDKPDTVKLYIAHELSHLHLYQHVGDYAYLCIPSWFAEGLAAFVSNGGGAEKVSDAEVKEFIRSGNHFQPIEKAGIGDLFVPKYASYWGISHQHKHHMFYRQCMLFVSFLANESPEKFKKFLITLENGKEFADAFRSSLGADAMTKWDEFKNQT